MPGCGAHIAHQLSLYGLGELLLDAANDIPFSELPTFLISWRAKLRHALSVDPDGHLGRKYAALANAVSDTFPNPTTLLRYTAPTTSWSDGGPGRDFSELRPRQPDIAKLASLCERFFSWGTSSGILEKFDSIIWDGACLRMLTDVRDYWCTSSCNLPLIEPLFPQDWTIETRAGVHHRPAMPPFNVSSILRITSSKMNRAPAMSFKSYRIEFSTGTLILVAKSGIKGLRAATLNTLGNDYHAVNNLKSFQPRSRHSAWIPASILRHALPEMVNDFHKSHKFKTVVGELLPPGPVSGMSNYHLSS